MDVSVVVPTYNRRPVLQRTVECLLRQDFGDRNYEIVVLDDQSTDDTAEWLQQTAEQHKRLRVLRNPRKGRAQARNAGIEAAHGRVICFVDDDVWVAPGFVNAHWEAHQAHGPKLVGIGGIEVCSATRWNLVNEYADGLHLRVKQRIQTTGDILGVSAFRTGNVSVSRHLLLEIGGFDEDFVGLGFEDAELGYRLRSCGAVLRFVPRAEGEHFTEVTVPDVVRRQESAGRGAVVLLKRWPEAADGIPVPFAISGVGTTVRHDSALKRCLKAVIVSAPAGGLIAAVLWLAMRVGWRAGSFALLDLLGYNAYARAFREAARKVE